MDITRLSSKYQVRKLNEQDIDAIYKLSAGNPLYYQHCPPYVTHELILEDMTALPPGTGPENKFYMGYFLGNRLVAVMDLIIPYPKERIAWIGLFMMEKSFQGKGIGTEIIEECTTYLKSQCLEAIQLGFIKGNPQSEGFWLKNGFVRTGRESERPEYTVVVTERKL